MPNFYNEVSEEMMVTHGVVLGLAGESPKSPL